MSFNFDFTFEYYNDACKQEFATVHLIPASNGCSNLILGPICDYCLASVSRVAKYIGYNGMPVVTPGGFTFAFSTEKTKCSHEYYMTINTGPTDFRSFGEFFHLIMNRYKWRKIALMYEKDQQNEVGGENTCKFIMESIVEEVKYIDKLDYEDGDLVLLQKGYRYYLEQIVGVKYGLILTCTNSTGLREFAIEAYKMNMMESGEYTVFNFQTYNSFKDPSKPWYDSDDSNERNEMARKAFRSIYTFAPSDEASFANDDKSNRNSIYLDGLYDGMILYANALNESLSKSNRGPGGYELVKNMMGMKYTGKDGRTVSINCNGQRVASYVLLQMNSSDMYDVVAEYTNLNKTISSWTVEWMNGKDPLDTPLCGYDMSLCPKFDTVKILLITLILVLCLGVLIVGIILYRYVHDLF
jgi:hypothetical protein